MRRTLMHNVEGNLKLGRAVTDPTPSLNVVVDRPDKPEEACGVFAVLASDQPVANLTYFGLYALCLLYTSPSPRDATLSRMPSSA